MAQENSITNGGPPAPAKQPRRWGGRAQPVAPAAALAALTAVCLATAVSSAGCGSKNDSLFGKGGVVGGGDDAGKNTLGGGITVLPDGAIGYTDTDGGLPIVCAAGSGAQCNDQNCGGGATTVITGRVLDPAGKNPLWNVTVFVRDTTIPLPDLSTQSLACGCGNIYPADVLGYATTDAKGVFTINSAPYGTNIDLVVQIGKWRKEYSPFTIERCATNTIPDLTLPKDSSEGNLPNIAISTGGADSLECLPLRMGVSASEYVGGNTGNGHIHIFQGYNGANTAPAAPQSYQGLWDSTADLEKHDVVLLSCEGHETTGGGTGGAGGGGAVMSGAYQQSLQDYADKGGRVFASHYHYAWFTPPPAGAAGGFATANIATWQGSNGVSEAIDDMATFNADIDQTLPGGGAFAEGVAMKAWLGNVNALTNQLLPIQYARMNVVSLKAPPSVEWIHLDSSVTASSVKQQGTNFVDTATQYFSLDTPLNATGENVCGRVVYSDLHVSGGPGAAVGNLPADYSTGGRGGGGGGTMMGGTVPSGCAMHDLSPQEKALEFMLFDLSSCLVPTMGSPPPPPPTVPPK
jgi:hypothetical protein